MKSRPVNLCVVICTMHVSMALCGCGGSSPRAEIDCSRFAHDVARNAYIPPAASDTIDTKTAESMILRKVLPKYPELAIRAGLEGTVWVKLWIGRDGIVKQALVVKSDAEIFDDASLDAARRLVFTAPLCRGKAVSVWATIPIKYKLLHR